MLSILIKAMAPIFLSTIGIDDWLSPVKQESPVISMIGSTAKNIGNYILNEMTDDETISDNTDTDDINIVQETYDKYLNKSYNMEFK